MKQTTVKIEGMKAIVGDAWQVKRGDGGVREDAHFLGGTATVRAMGHGGHVMPSSLKPSAVKPAKEKIKMDNSSDASDCQTTGEKGAEPFVCDMQPPWTLVRADLKRLVQFNILKDLIEDAARRFECKTAKETR